MPNFIKFTPEKLNSVSLSVLREIARQIGVKSPSSKSVPALISEIILIQRGELAPVKSTRGARSKPVDVSAYYEVKHVYPPEECVEYDAKPVESLLFKDDSVVDREGFFALGKNGVGYLRGSDFTISDKDAVLSNEIIEEYDLRQGDFIKCKVVCYGDKNTVRAVTEINGKRAIDHAQFMDFSNLPTFYADELINLEGTALGKELMEKAPINKGQRAIIAVPYSVDKSLLMVELAKTLKNTDLKTSILLVGENPEEIDEIKRIVEVEVVSTRFDTGYEIQTAVAELLVERAKRAVERDEDVVIIINSTTNLVKAYLGEDAYGGNSLTTIVPALMKVKRIMSSAVKTSRGSLTILSIIDYADTNFDTVIFDEMSRVCNMRAVLNSSSSIDEKLSFTKRYANKV